MGNALGKVFAANDRECFGFGAPIRTDEQMEEEEEKEQQRQVAAHGCRHRVRPLGIGCELKECDDGVQCSLPGRCYHSLPFTAASHWFSRTAAVATRAAIRLVIRPTSPSHFSQVVDELQCRRKGSRPL